MLDIEKPEFVFGEAMEVAGTSRGVLNNWLQRGVADIGQKDRTGRRYFSVMDLIELRVMAELISTSCMTPSMAAELATLVKAEAQDRVNEIMAASEKEQRDILLAEREDNGMLTAWHVFGEWKLLSYDYATEAQVAGFGPAVLIPLDGMIVHVLRKCTEILNEN